MNSVVINKQEIIDNLCYTELVYSRINKKLGLNYSKTQIEEFILNLIKTSPKESYNKIGKNYYITNFEHKVRMTINSYTFRIITADKII